MRNVAVVNLNLKVKDVDFEKFSKRTAKVKIDIISRRINNICQKLLKKEPLSDWIISWREYGITAQDCKFISNEDKKYLKKKMAELTKKYPQLTIISGTVATKKTFSDDITKLNNVAEFYKNNTWVDKAEVNLDDETELQKFHHLRTILRLKKQKEISEIHVIRNTAYVFNNGTCIARHDKVAPFFESAHVKNDWCYADVDELEANMQSNYIFQPGNKKGNSRHVFINSIHNGKIHLLLEICREHLIGDYPDYNKMTTEADIQLVIGFGGFLNFDNIRAKYFILLDCSYSSQIIVTENLNEKKLKKIPIRLYQNNLLSFDTHLGEHLSPYALKEKKVFSVFDELITLYKDKSDELFTIKKLRNEFCDSSDPDHQKAYKEWLFGYVNHYFFYFLLNSLNTFVDNKELDFVSKAQPLFAQLFKLLKTMEPKLYPITAQELARLTANIQSSTNETEAKKITTGVTLFNPYKNEVLQTPETIRKIRKISNSF